MKKLILLVTAITFVFSCEKQDPLPPNTYEITGTAKGVINGLRAYIKTVDARGREKAVDTAIVMNEAFMFSGNISEASLKVITINSIDGKLPIVFESGRLSIDINKDSVAYSKIEGSQTSIDYELYKSAFRIKASEIAKTRKEVRQNKGKVSRELIAELKAKDRALVNELNEYDYEFIKEHPKSQVSVLLLSEKLKKANPNLDKLKESANTLKKIINKNDANKLVGQKVNAFIELKEMQAFTEVGKIAPNFSSPTPDGDMLSLNDIKGKATIIDFWASWCGPCRRENPNVVKIYEKYHDKGLEIISVSLDKPGQKNRWLKAIEDDNLNWHHVGSLEYFRDPIARMFNVNSIPATFILDNEGKIVAKKLRGDALEKQIAALLD